MSASHFAFPQLVNVAGPTTDPFTGAEVPAGETVQHVLTGITTRQYLAAHAPAIPAWWVDKYLVLKPEATTADLAAEAAEWALAWADAVLERTK